MKQTCLLSLAAAVTAYAVVVPDGLGPEQIVMQRKTPVQSEPWWGETRDGYAKAVEDLMNNIADSAEHGIDAAMRGLERMGQTIGRELGSLLDGREPEDDGMDRHRGHQGRRHGHGHGHGHARDNDRTIWEMLKESKYTTRFVKLVEEHDDVKEKLKDRKNDYTLFVPTDRAFEDLLDGGDKKPSREFLDEILRYHIVPGRYSAGTVMSAHTLPTALELRDLGHHHQRLRISCGLMGIYVNFYSKVVATNIAACNGYVHAVDRLLVPPPRQGRLIDALPGQFSTFSLAMERTGLGEHLHRAPQRGGTVFAPTNNAFMKLGPRLNEFLFADRGAPYLQALLRYHVVANETLYSDAYYQHQRERGGDKDRREKGYGDMFPGGNYNVHMRTELGEKCVAVAIRRWMGMISMTVNGWIPVSVQDGIRRVVPDSSTPIDPPCPPQVLFPRKVFADEKVPTAKTALSTSSIR